MDRVSPGAALAALFLSTLALSGCGSDGSSTPVAPAGGPPAAEAVTGVSTPSSVSVVTAKNAERAPACRRPA